MILFGGMSIKSVFVVMFMNGSVFNVDGLSNVVVIVYGYYVVLKIVDFFYLCLGVDFINVGVLVLENVNLNLSVVE